MLWCPSLFFLSKFICSKVVSIILSLAIGLKKLIIINIIKLNNKVISLNLYSLLDSKIIKIAERLMKKKDALSPLKKIKTSGHEAILMRNK